MLVGDGCHELVASSRGLFGASSAEGVLVTSCKSAKGSWVARTNVVCPFYMCKKHKHSYTHELGRKMALEL